MVAQIPQKELRLVAQVHHDLGEEVRYQHELYPVPKLADEEIEQLIEVSWHRKKSEKMANLYLTLFLNLVVLSYEMGVEFNQFNGIVLPFGEGMAEWYLQLIELSLIILFIASGIFVFLRGVQIHYVIGISFIHFLLISAIDGNSVLYLLLIGYVVMIWKGAVDYFKNDHKGIVDRYLKYIRLLR